MKVSSKAHHIIVFEGPFERPGERILWAFGKRKKSYKVIKKVSKNVEISVLNGVQVPEDVSKHSTTKLHFIEIGRKPGAQAFEVHYDVVPKYGQESEVREIPGVQLNEKQMMEILNRMEPLLKKYKIAIRWIKPGEEVDV